MKPPKQERPSQEWRVHGTNDAWKAQWNTRVAWSMVAAVAVHVAVFAVGPNWETPALSLDLELDPVELAWISFFEAPSSGMGASPGAPPVAEFSDSTTAEPDVGEGGAGVEGGMGDFSEILRQRLLRRGGPVPTIAEPEPKPEPERPSVDDPDGTAKESTSIGGDASTADLSTLPEPTSLDLSRLSALRPDIVLAGVSAWVLVMNPAEVVRFMRRSFSWQDLGPGVSGSVSVVLFIDEKGSVEWAEISQSSGISDVDEIFLTLFNEIVAFRPARDQGVPVPRSAIFSLAFPW